MSEAPAARWMRVKAIVADAIELAPASRPAWIDQACQGDPALAAEVEALLRAHEQAGAFLEAPALAAPGAAERVILGAGPPAGPALPPRFGPYRTLRELGRGGMGVVYLAARDDDRFEKHVAIKVVFGDVVGPAVFRRFEDERRILASLDDPSIARLLDAGTTEGGLPYLVMEYVEGETIDRYCEARHLAVRERLALFLRVCGAVQSSHQRLVVHRDIKARNILVTAAGVPKLLDFGIATLLDPAGGDGGRTRTAFRMLTPESASPEQVRGEPVTVGTDVYSLGVLLYRLLTGRSPYRGGLATNPEIERAVCEEEPLRPSDAAALRELRGDLDLITLKALRKEPARRYPSVEQLAQDVQRHLDRRPVRAAPDAWTYRAGKFISRRWVGLGAATAVTLALLLGGAATWWQARRAQRRFDDLHKLAHTVMFDIHDSIAMLPGSTAARKLLVTEALAYLDGLAREAGGDAALQRELASGYEKMADVLGRPSTPNLGDVHGALQVYQKAQAARERILARRPDDADVLRELSTTSQKMSRAWYQSGDPYTGAAEARKASLIEERLAASDAAPAQEFRLARSYANDGFLLYVSGRSVESRERLRAAIKLLEALLASPAASAEIKSRLAVTYGYEAALLRSGAPVAGVVPDLKTALELQQKAVGLDAELVRAAGVTPALQRQVMVDLMSLGDIQAALGDSSAAQEQYRAGLGRAEELARADAANLQAQKDLAWTCQRLGALLATGGSTEEALALLGRSARLLQPVAAADPADTNTRANIAATDEGMARAHLALAARPALSPAARLGHWREARSRFQAAYDFWKELRDSGRAPASDGARPAALAVEIAKCDAALGAGPAGAAHP